MKILGFIVVREKKYNETISRYEDKIKELETKVGSLQYEKRKIENIAAVLEKFIEE